MDDRPIVLDVKDVKKKYLIRHNFEKPDSFSGKLKLACNKIAHPTKKYNTEDFYALNGVTFQIKQGEKVGIIGKNGAGKSTLLKVISRITEPSDGRIEFLGKVSAMLEVGTGFNAELTGRENVYLNGAILGMSKDEIDSKFDEIIEFSEIGKFIDTPVKRYSSGMFVRLAFAVASNLDPDILLVDEVLSVGDMRFQRKCIEKMKTISNSGKTIICVSHQMQTIRQLCDRVIVLKAGEVVLNNVNKGTVQDTWTKGVSLEGPAKLTLETVKIDTNGTVKYNQSAGDLSMSNTDLTLNEGASVITGGTVDLKTSHLVFNNGKDNTAKITMTVDDGSSLTVKGASTSLTTSAGTDLEYGKVTVGDGATASTMNLANDAILAKAVTLAVEAESTLNLKDTAQLTVNTGDTWGGTIHQTGGTFTVLDDVVKTCVINAESGVLNIGAEAVSRSFVKALNRRCRNRAHTAQHGDNNGRNCEQLFNFI